MQDRLQAYLRQKLPQLQEVQVSGLRRMTEGYSYETFSFRLEGSQGGQVVARELVLRMEPEHGPVPPYDVSRQYLALKALQNSPVPVPPVLWLERDPAVLGKPFFLMERVEGEVPLLWRSGRASAQEDPAQRARIADQFLQVLAHIHTADWQALGLEALGVPQDEAAFARKELRRWERALQENQLVPQPVLREALRWLKSRIPPARYTTLVHGDYRLGNFIWREGRIAAFLDWEMVDIGDPMSDVGWACMPRFAGRSGLIMGLYEQEDFFRHYQERTGFKLDKESVFWWQVFGYFKLGTIQLAGIRACAQRMKRDIRWMVIEFDYYQLLSELGQLLGF